MSVTQLVCGFVALGIQYKMRMCHIVICSLPREHYLINGTIFEKKKKVVEHNICVSSFSAVFVRNVFHCKRK
jgi:hypothetical protein